MRISKYIIAIIIFSAAILIINIFSVNSIPYNIPDDCIVYLSSPEYPDLAEIESAAEKYGIDVYAIAETEVSFNKNDDVIYATGNTEKIKKHLGLKSGIVKDILGNQKNIRYEKFETLSSSKDMQNIPDRIYLSGRKEDCEKIFQELETSCSCVSSVQYPEIFGEQLIPFGIIAVMLTVLLFTCYVDSAFYKKEIALRVLHGDSSIYHYFRYCMINTLGYAAVFAVCIIGQNTFFQTLSCYKRVYYLLIPFFAVLWLMNLHIINPKPKEMLYGYQTTPKLIYALNAVQIVAAAASCAVILSMFTLVPKIKNSDKGEDFFKNKRNCYFISMQLKNDKKQFSETDINYNKRLLLEKKKIYNKIDEQTETICIQDISSSLNDYEMSDTEWTPVYCNYSALSYIRKVYPEAEDAELENYDAVILIPDTLSENEQNTAENFLSEQFRCYEGYKTENVEVIRYNADKEMMVFGNKGECSFSAVNNCAVIIASDTFQREDADKLHIDHADLYSGTVYQIKNLKEIEKITNDSSFEPVFTNINEYLEENKKAQNSIAAIILIVTCLILVIYVSVTYTILNAEYQVNAMEFAVKKIHGYSIFQKNRKSFIEIGAVGIINFIISVLYVRFNNYEYPEIAVIVPVCIIIFNLITVTAFITKIESQKLVKIIKGGAL